MVPRPPQDAGHAITLARWMLPPVIALLNTPGKPGKYAALPPHGRPPPRQTPGKPHTLLSTLLLRLAP
eukprot:14966793-Heterocapsa_arctica.AAC.1